MTRHWIRVAAVAVLLALPFGGVALPSPEERVEAPRPDLTVYLSGRVRDDLQTVVGEVRLIGDRSVRLDDVLGRLPVPQDDQLQRRTFPFDHEQGWVHTHQVQPGWHTFHSVLPRRYDASGNVPGKGLFANGLWHPQPIVGNRAGLVRWEVDLELPADAIGVLNGVVGKGRLQWSGVAERLALAVFERGRVSRMPLPAGELVIVEHGRPKARRNARLAEIVTQSWPGPSAPQVVVVETPSRRRMARSGPQTLFLSDRATRLMGRLWRYHTPAVRRGVLASSLPIEDPWLRELAAGTLSDAADDPSAAELLGWFAWIPEVDSLLYDGRLPFFSDLFDETWPADVAAVPDDMLEIVEPVTPARVVARRIATVYGADAAVALGEALVAGRSLTEAADMAGVPLADIADWRALAPPQDLALVVEPAGESWAVAVTRDTTPQAPLEPVSVVIDDQPHLWLAGPGADAEFIMLDDRPDRVHVDPGADVQQTDRSNDRWPIRWTATTAFFPYELNAGTGRISAAADVALRKQYDTRWLYVLGVGTDTQDLVSTFALARYAFGPLKDRRSRRWRTWLEVGGSLLDPDFRPVDEGRYTIGASTGLTWDTRISDTFPSEGHRVGFGVAGGRRLGGTSLPEDRNWASATLSAKKLLRLHGRATLATRAKSSVAAGDIEHRLLSLGGSDDVQGLSANLVLGERKLIAATELRVQPIRYANIPMGLWWGSDLQLSAGLEAGVLQSAGANWWDTAETFKAVGWTAGLAGVGDVLGARPTLAGVWVAGPLATWPDGLDTDPMPEIYVRLTQAF